MVVALASRHAPVKVGGDVCNGNGAKALQQQRLGLLECVVELRIDSLLHQAFRPVAGWPDGKQRRRADGLVDVEQRHPVEPAGQLPATAMALFGTDIPMLTQARHGAPDDDGIGAEHPGDGL
jgi:hypothetical protein